MKQLLLILILIFCYLTNAQEKTLQFPNDYLGVYKGDLNIHSVKGVKEIGMEFHLIATEKTDQYQYMLVYVFDGKRQERKYTLLAKDASKGQYLVDENNGIVLNAQLFDNTLYFIFEVEGTIITTTLRFYKDAMNFEITATSKDKKHITGQETIEVSEVISYPITTMQKALLLKE